MVVRSPKIEHHEGKESRIVPIFPELQPYLEAARNELLEDFDPKQYRLSEQPVIKQFRQKNCNLRSRLKRIILVAGLKPWPKLWHNLRGTRQTELSERYPDHVVCSWIGNSQVIAAKHYLQTTDEHYESAATEPTGALQKALPKTADDERNEAQEVKANDEISPDCASLRYCAPVFVVKDGLVAVGQLRV